MDDWMLIETAPAAQKGLRIIIIGGCHPEPEIALADGDWWRENQRPGSGCPTHWQYLPTPPETA